MGGQGEQSGAVFHVCCAGQMIECEWLRVQMVLNGCCVAVLTQNGDFGNHVHLCAYVMYANREWL